MGVDWCRADEQNYKGPSVEAKPVDRSKAGGIKPHQMATVCGRPSLSREVKAK